jgi:hypothetical protein
VYDGGLVDAVTRPILRCLTPSRAKDEFLPGPLFGRAVWMSWIPDKTSAILISPGSASLSVLNGQLKRQHPGA